MKSKNELNITLRKILKKINACIFILLCSIDTTYLPTGIEANEAESTTSNKKVDGDRNVKIKYNLRKRKHTDEEGDKGKYFLYLLFKR